jgi:hypothetical protein
MATPGTPGAKHRSVDIRRTTVWALLVALLAAAATGLVLLFIGGQDDVLKVLLSVLVFAGAMVLALPAQLHPVPWLQVATGALCLVTAALMWTVIWLPEDAGASDALGRTVGMIGVLLVVLGVALVVLAMVRGPRLRPARVAAWVSHVTGIALLGIVWAAILTDGEALPPGRIVGGIAIIYVTTSLVAMLIALMRRYKVVARDPDPEGPPQP